ncbi:MAG: HD domain-containing protein [Candidatus Sericytochromatia bacterium]|nr:HD domain-containing protein [Candidatus Sericytochromatia bacterium]
MATLDQAVALAAQAHLGQLDKAGAPYILHPLRVMFRCQSDEARMAAVLHDVVEDTPITLDDLRQRGFADSVVAAVDRLTRSPDETYEAFIDRVKTDPIALEVKIADLEDNMDVRRMADPQPKDFERLAKYRRAWRELTGR